MDHGLGDSQKTVISVATMQQQVHHHHNFMCMHISCRAYCHFVKFCSSSYRLQCTLHMRIIMHCLADVYCYFKILADFIANF